MNKHTIRKKIMTVPAALLLILLFLLSLGSCSKGKDTALKITQDEFDAEVAKTLAQYEAQGQSVPDEQKAALRKAVLGQMVERVLLLHEAEKAGVKVDQSELDSQYKAITARFPSEEALNDALSQRGYTPEMFRKEMEGIMTIQKFLDQTVLSKIEVSEDDMKAYYDENPDYFAKEETVTASHILINVAEDATPEEQADALSRAKDVAAKVAAGGDFAELAKKYSEGPSAANGGSLGSFSRGKMVPAFEDAAFALKKGEVSDIVKTQYGYHIIKVTDRSEPGTLSFDEAKDAIEGFLKQQKQQDAVTEYVDSLKEKYTVETPEI